MIRLSPQGKWENVKFISCGKLLRMRADVLEHQCPKCKRWSIRWADCNESNYCSHCGERMTKEDSGWIPVSERLPDKNMPCLVSVGEFNFTQIAMYSNLMGTINHKIFWQGDYGKNNFQNITEYVNAWQPLPESYKKEETT